MTATWTAEKGTVTTEMMPIHPLLPDILVPTDVYRPPVLDPDGGDVVDTITLSIDGVIADTNEFTVRAPR